jgi:hypothetical protein
MEHHPSNKGQSYVPGDLFLGVELVSKQLDTELTFSGCYSELSRAEQHLLGIKSN